jgi:predicted N-acetyltransferase YhbS
MNRFAQALRLALPKRPALPPVPPQADEFASIREEMAQDFLAREALLDRSFGTGRWRKTCERLREGRLPAPGLAFSATKNRILVGTLRFWSVDAGGCDALMLGPVAVASCQRSQGLGGQMIRHGLLLAGALGHKAVILVGDAPYYERFGFSRAGAQALNLPGPVDPARFLALELQPGALAGATGLVRATGVLAESKSDQRLAA